MVDIFQSSVFDFVVYQTSGVAPADTTLGASCRRVGDLSKSIKSGGSE